MRSYFISSTLNPAKAGGMSPQILVMAIDRRRMVWNLMSDFDENEILIPLLIFPDEILGVVSSVEKAIQLGKSAKGVKTIPTMSKDEFQERASREWDKLEKMRPRSGRK
jgi:hypothetical protein